MQIIWVSSPVGHIRKINLSYRHLLIGSCLLVFALILAGAGLQYFGFRMAIEYDPQLAKQLGNLHSPVEIENLNAVYQLKLLELNERIVENNQKLHQLEVLSQKLEQLATPSALKGQSPKQNSIGGKFIPLNLVDAASNPRPLKLFSNISSLMHLQDERTNALIAHNSNFLEWLESKPTGMPIQNSSSISSDYGPRIDPFNQRESFHSGLDFQSPNGTPITVTANGRVLKANWDSNYGKLLIIDHGDGYLSRYAHTQDIYVHEGDIVKRNQVVATVGTSGRSTGPHLHYEIVKNGEVINPKEMLIGLSNR
jgi:murein DD-endopeptidase MepM/ murein hydrolase activator NlpD